MTFCCGLFFITYAQSHYSWLKIFEKYFKHTSKSISQWQLNKLWHLTVFFVFLHISFLIALSIWDWSNIIYDLNIFCSWRSLVWTPKYQKNLLAQFHRDVFDLTEIICKLIFKILIFFWEKTVDWPVFAIFCLFANIIDWKFLIEWLGKQSSMYELTKFISKCSEGIFFMKTRKFSQKYIVANAHKLI